MRLKLTQTTRGELKPGNRYGVWESVTGDNKRRMEAGEFSSLGGVMIAGNLPPTIPSATPCWLVEVLEGEE